MARPPSLSPDRLRVEPGDRPRRPDAQTMAGADAGLRRMALGAQQFQAAVRDRPQRVVVKTTIEQHQPGAGVATISKASQYVSRTDAQPQIFGRGGPVADLPMVREDRDGTSRRADALSATQLHEWGRDPRHFHVIISPERRMTSDQLVRVTRQAMARLEQSTGAKLEWRATIHRNTEHPHVHVLLRGRDPETRTPLFLKPQDLAEANRGAQIEATRILGPAPEQPKEQAAERQRADRGRGVER